MENLENETQYLELEYLEYKPYFKSKNILA